MRAKYYDPGTGRFNSEDPLGFKSQDYNLYRYPKNNPLVNNDPYGKNPFILWPIRVICGIFNCTGAGGPDLNPNEDAEVVEDRERQKEEQERQRREGCGVVRSCEPEPQPKPEPGPVSGNTPKPEENKETLPNSCPA